ncbi:MAG: hypothetical protein PF486_09650 [Prolixibacteraceae bacterium]|nr:hypothetical protein [Prolixibacteraceae bacterium]
MREDFSEAERSEVSRKIDEEIPITLAASINQALSRGGVYWNIGILLTRWEIGILEKWNVGKVEK